MGLYGIRIVPASGKWLPNVDREEPLLRITPDIELFWHNRPNLRDLAGNRDLAPRSTNSLDFRGTEDIPDEKAEGEYRIFVVGDSSMGLHELE